MDYSTAIHRLHNTHSGTESNASLSGSIEEDSMPRDKCHRNNIPSGYRLEEFQFSFIIDDVDADHESELSDERTTARLNEIYATDGAPSTETTDSVHNKEKSDARIQQIKGEAESRKNEFAKLLEEHAQVIKQLKQMEDEPASSGGEAGPTDV